MEFYIYNDKGIFLDRISKCELKKIAKSFGYKSIIKITTSHDNICGRSKRIILK